MSDSASKQAPIPLADKVIAVCEAHWDQYASDCSGFVKKVGAELGIVLNGQANDIIKTISGTWSSTSDGARAAGFAAQGKFVIAGLVAQPNGHVVVVVKGPLNRNKYPTAYWGTLGSTGKKNTTINWSWGESDRDKVIYYYCNFGRTNKSMPTSGMSINWNLKEFEKKVRSWLGI